MALLAITIIGRIAYILIRLPCGVANGPNDYSIISTPDEIKNILGWVVNTRLFRIFLPIEKANEWIHSIKSIIKHNIITGTIPESTIGHLNHAGYILPQARYFLNRLQHFLIKCQTRGPQQLSQAVRDDLLL